MLDFLRRLRAINVDRCENYYQHPLRDWTNMEWGCAAAGEMGELCNILKKVDRELTGIKGSRVEGDQRRAVGDEMADVVIYLDLLAARWGIDLQDAIAGKFNRDSIKVGFTTPLESDDAT